MRRTVSVLLAIVGLACAADDTFFETRVRPVLAEHCLKCHTADKAKGGLLLDSRAGMLKGGDSGPAIVPGKPDQSLLIKAVSYAVDGMEMPPKGKLPPNVVADLAKWVGEGARWPGGGDGGAPGSTAKAATKDDYDRLRREHWAWQLPRPAPAGDLTATIDRLIAAPLAARKLTPAPEADRRTLIRRAHFDLTGLPPTAEEVAAFVADQSPQAWPALVDRLLASPRFGERWGRHWMDVARYSDSSGGGANITFDAAWRYRDWIVDAFNRDLPYDRFVADQIAGDLMPAKDDAERARGMVATGFLIVGPHELAEYDKAKVQADVVDEQIDSIGRAFLGLTLGCARCHDHKFDPVTNRDYYAMAGVLTSTRAYEGVFEGPITGYLSRPLPGPKADSPERKTLLAEKAQLEAKLKQLDAAFAAAKKKNQTPPQSAFDERVWTDRQIRFAARRIEALDSAVAVAEAAKPVDARILIRGDVNNPGASVPRGAPGFLPSLPSPTIPAKASGRLELARWLVDRRNPFTARVMANRVWHHLFGAGLSRTPDNFGLRGEAPSHHDLLDALATRFAEDGWSVKKLIRAVMLSRAYRASTATTPEHAAADPENRLLAHQNRRRLQAEAIRDAILATSGRLDLAAGGSTMTICGRLTTRISYIELKRDPWRRRSVWLPIYRGALGIDLFEVFDFADPGMVVGARSQTTIPAQALFLMNSPWMRGEARATAERLLKAGGDDAAVLERGCLAILGRPPTAAEKTRDLAFIGANRSGRLDAWTDWCHVRLSSNEFLFLD